MKIKKTVVTTTKPSAKVNLKKTGKIAAEKPQPEKSAAKPTDDKAERNGVNFGRTTGLRVMFFQDQTLATNDVAKRPAPLAHIPGQLTDTELAKVWREEFPNSRAVLNGRIDESIVRGVRNLYNQGTSGHGTSGKTFDSKPYIVVDGKRVVTGYTRAKKGAAEAEAKAVEAKATAPKGPAIVKTGKAKVVVARRKKAA